VLRRDEPVDHAIGRSRGGLTMKTHAIVDGRCLPLVIAITGGRRMTHQRWPNCCASCALRGPAA
jgi:hypothetical protein